MENETKKQQYNEIAKQYFAENKTIDENTLSAFLQANVWKIYDIYDKDCKRCDIRLELEEREIKHSNKDVEDILEVYEDYLSENDAWRDCLNEAINDVLDR